MRTPQRRLALLPALLALGSCATAPRAPAASDAAQRAASGSAKTRCPNYADAMRSSTFPADAVRRGINQGSATVRFTVTNEIAEHIEIVAATDPAFGDAAAGIVRMLRCTVDRPTVFEIPLQWKRD